MGGNLWVARFWEPGVIDPATGRVSNWFVSRSFEERRQADDSQAAAGRSPFFFMTGNTFDIERGYLRTYAGSGNRERLLDAQQTCSPDNVLGCCQAGCTVTSSTATDDYGTCQVAQSFSCSGGTLTASAVAAGSCTSPFTCGQNKVTATLNLDCGSGALPPITATLTCDSAGVCSQVQPFGTGRVSAPSTTPPKSRMYGVWAYGGTDRTFDTKALAQTFDTRRFTDVAYANACPPASSSQCTLVEVTRANYALGSGVTCTVGTKCEAQPLDPGWMYEYGTQCPLQSCSPAPPWNDEKTATGAPPMGGCVLWSSTRPTGSSGGDPCTSSVGAPTAYSYIVDYLSGAPSQACGNYGATGSNLYQAAVRNSPAPPQNPMPRIVVTAGGQVKYSSLQMDAGSQPQSTTLGYRDAITELLYYLEVPRDLHTCRHVDPTTCK
jgi:type IV pilus assembly protein PilY1